MVVTLRFGSQAIAGWRQARAIGQPMPKPRVTQQGIAAEQPPGFRLD